MSSDLSNETAPERIWLPLLDAEIQADRVSKSDVEYVRADLLAQVEQERDELRKIADDALRFRVEINGSCNHDEHMTKLCTQCEIRAALEKL